MMARRYKGSRLYPKRSYCRFYHVKRGRGPFERTLVLVSGFIRLPSQGTDKSQSPASESVTAMEDSNN